MSGPLQHENTHSACIHTHIYTYAYTCKHTDTESVCIFPPPSPSAPSASPAVIDVLFHSAQHKLRHHGYSCSDVLSPGDGQYWNNNSLNNTTNHTHPPPSFLTTHPPPHSPCRLVVSGAVCHVKGNYWSWQHYRQRWQVCVLCQLLPLTLPRACSSVSLGKTLETWQQALWVKD